MVQVALEPRVWSAPPTVTYSEPVWFWYGVATGVLIGVTLGLLIMDALRYWWPAVWGSYRAPSDTTRKT